MVSPRHCEWHIEDIPQIFVELVKKGRWAVNIAHLGATIINCDTSVVIRGYMGVRI